jgi:hypothetical protein
MPGATGLRVRGVVPLRVPSIYTEAPPGVLPRYRTPPGSGVLAVVSTTNAFWTIVFCAAAAAGTGEGVLMPGAGSPETDPEDIPAAAGAGTIAMRRSMRRRRPVFCFIFSPEIVFDTPVEPGFIGIAVAVPATLITTRG